MNIAFFGNTKYSVIDARVLHARFGLVLIVTKPDKPSGRNRTLTPNPVKMFALEHKIPLIEADKLDSKVTQEIKNYDLDFIVVADYGLIVPDEILEIPKYAPLNVHHSLLPKYRGPTPAPAAILAGETETGVTVIKMTSSVDAGDMYAQVKYTLKPEDTTDSVLTGLNTIGGKMVCEVIEDFEKLTPKKQDDSKSINTPRMGKQDSFIDPQNPPDPQTFDRMVRAYYPKPIVWTKINDKILKFLPGNKIQPEGKKPMMIKEFLNGYPQVKPLLEKLLTKN